MGYWKNKKGNKIIKTGKSTKWQQMYTDNNDPFQFGYPTSEGFFI